MVKTFKNSFSICVNTDNWYICEKCNTEVSHCFDSNNSIITIKFVNEYGKVEKYSRLLISDKVTSYAEEQKRTTEIQKYISEIITNHYKGIKDFTFIVNMDFNNNEILTVSFLNKRLNKEDFCFSSYSTTE